MYQYCRVSRGDTSFSGNSVTPTTKMSIDFPKEEEAVLRRWKEIKAFETQVSDWQSDCLRENFC